MQHEATEERSVINAPALIVTLTAFGAVIVQLAGVTVSPIAWVVIFAAYFALQLRTLKASGAIILGASIVLFNGVWLLHGEAYPDGFNSAGFLFVLLVTMQYMADLAGRSPAISRAAQIIVSRPAGERYLFVTFGTHVFALFLQIGAVILLTSLLGARLKDAAADTVRSLTIAVLRGFACTAMWSPLSIGILIIFSQVTGVDYAHYVPLGIAFAVFFLLAGYWMERGRRAKVREKSPLTRADWLLLGRVGGLSGVLVLSGLAWEAVFGVRLIEAMFTVVFLFGIAWTLAALANGGLTVPHAAAFLSRGAAGLGNELAIITGASIIGAVGSGLIEEWTGLGHALSPAIAALAAFATPAIIFGGAMLALNPVLTVTVVAGGLNTVWPEGAKLWLIFVLSWGWVLSAGGTPFTANVLMTAQKMDESPYTVSLKWNGPFIATMAIFASTVGATGTYFLGG